MEIDDSKELYNIYALFCESNGVTPIAIREQWRKHWKEEYLGKKEALNATEPPSRGKW